MSDNDAPPPATDGPENTFEIDWTKEPSSDRERRIRAVMLRDALAEWPSFVWLRLRTLLGDSRTPCSRPQDAASDFREAYAKGEAIDDQIAAERKTRRLEHAIREVDGARE